MPAKTLHPLLKLGLIKTGISAFERVCIEKNIRGNIVAL